MGRGKGQGSREGGRPDEGAKSRDDDALTLGIKRAAEMAAVFMIGDGALGLLQASRHVGLWRSAIPAVDALVKPFGGKPGRRRAYGAVQIATGIALAAALRRGGRGKD